MGIEWGGMRRDGCPCPCPCCCPGVRREGTASREINWSSVCLGEWLAQLPSHLADKRRAASHWYRPLASGHLRQQLGQQGAQLRRVVPAADCQVERRVLDPLQETVDPSWRVCCHPFGPRSIESHQFVQHAAECCHRTGRRSADNEVQQFDASSSPKERAQGWQVWCVGSKPVQRTPHVSCTVVISARAQLGRHV